MSSVSYTVPESCGLGGGCRFDGGFGFDSALKDSFDVRFDDRFDDRFDGAFDGAFDCGLGSCMRELTTDVWIGSGDDSIRCRLREHDQSPFSNILISFLKRLVSTRIGPSSSASLSLSASSSSSWSSSATLSPAFTLATFYDGECSLSISYESSSRGREFPSIEIF